MQACKHEAKLVLFAGRELPWWQNWRMALHVRFCSRCQHALAELQCMRRQVQDQLRQINMAPPGPDFWVGILQRLHAGEAASPNPEATRQPFVFWLRPAIYAAAGLLLIVSAWFLEDRAQEKLAASRDAPAVLVDQKHPRYQPTVENADMPGSTVLTFRTDDPKVTIVWFFTDYSISNID